MYLYKYKNKNLYVPLVYYTRVAYFIYLYLRYICVTTCAAAVHVYLCGYRSLLVLSAVPELVCIQMLDAVYAR
jgi:hypothetical protein